MSRDRLVVFRVSVEEAAELASCASGHGQRLSSWCRDELLHGARAEARLGLCAVVGVPEYVGGPLVLTVPGLDAAGAVPDVVEGYGPSADIPPVGVVEGG